MYGLINKALQAFLVENYGPALWSRVAHALGVGPEGFEAMLRYEDRLTEELIDIAARTLDKPRAALLEDVGAFLTTIEPLRRLLRFGGSDYWEFLFSLDELQGRGLMTLPDLELPELSLRSESGGRFVIEVRGPIAGWGAVMAGLLRAMADDYGALVLIEAVPPCGRLERVQVMLLEAAYASGRRFDLALPSAEAVA
ncbi:heme NO-binding protein [Sinirhodobacter ferrireducens]|uniref:Heme NO-binding protein n=1 Tax=Paenirhodobacter ferrireducens TaxID=1215032 RepID=A0A443LJN6_9RHOB|nr:heme NO-binding domain-containing protein [Sinirhodobacter ferrireducens]RWR49348.1 heme NO-binding protein [Sinirhodobacter ferrireducens]